MLESGSNLSQVGYSSASLVEACSAQCEEVKTCWYLVGWQSVQTSKVPYSACHFLKCLTTGRISLEELISVTPDFGLCSHFSDTLRVLR